MRGSLPIAAVLLAVCACAPINPDNRYTLAWLDEHAVPEATAARWGLAPVAVPVGLAAWLVDGLAIHPFLVWDDAWRDTADVVWTIDPADSPLYRAVSMPLRVIVTPIVYVFDFVARWLSPLDQTGFGAPSTEEQQHAGPEPER